MAKQSAHPNPQPKIYRLQQISGAIILSLIALALPLLIIVTLLTGAGNYLLIASLLVLLSLPIVMYLSVTPPVDLTDDGIHLHPLLWPDRFVPWADVISIQKYTLLPEAHSETTRRALQGRKRYRPAEGKMFIVRGLPIQYRVAGFFAGAQGQAIFAVTNRTHVEYDQFLKRLNKIAPAHLHEEASITKKSS